VDPFDDSFCMRRLRWSSCSMHDSLCCYGIFHLRCARNLRRSRTSQESFHDLGCVWNLHHIGTLQEITRFVGFCSIKTRASNCGTKLRWLDRRFKLVVRIAGRKLCSRQFASAMRCRLFTSSLTEQRQFFKLPRAGHRCQQECRAVHQGLPTAGCVVRTANGRE